MTFQKGVTPKLNLKQKQCPVCGRWFKPRSGVAKFCSESCKGKWKYITGHTTTESQYKTISGNWRKYLNRIVYRKRALHGLTTDDLLEVLERQNGRCALSGVELTCKLEKGTICKTNASVDRLVAGGSYSKDNVQLVCRAVNSFRTDLTVEDFVWWCKEVAKYNAE